MGSRLIMFFWFCNRSLFSISKHLWFFLLLQILHNLWREHWKRQTSLECISNLPGPDLKILLQLKTLDMETNIMVIADWIKGVSKVHQNICMIRKNVHNSFCFVAFVTKLLVEEWTEGETIIHWQTCIHASKHPWLLLITME